MTRAPSSPAQDTEARPIPALIQRILTAPRFAVEYLEHEHPVTWTTRRAEAFIFPDVEEADALARALSTRDARVFPFICDAQTIEAATPNLFRDFRPNEAATERAQHRRDQHDWHKRRDCGVE